MLLGDIVQLANFIREVRRSEPAIKTCAGLYELYRTFGDVVKVGDSVVSRIAVPLDDPNLRNTRAYPSPEAKWADSANNEFARLEKAVKRLIRQLHALDIVLEVHDPELLARLDFHLAMKSMWYSEFMRLYEAGHIDLPSRRVHRRVLRLASLDEIRALPRSWDIREGDLRPLERVEEYDISGAEAVERLVTAGRRNVEQLRAVRDELGAFLKTNCRLEDLMTSGRVEFD